IGLLGVGVATGVFFARARSAGTASDSGISARYSIAVSGLPNNESPAVSRDGQRIAFVAKSPDGSQSIWIMDLHAERPRELMGTSGAVSPFWSPDGRSIGFFADGALKRVDLAGGSPQRLYRVEESFGGTWGATGVIVFSQRYALYQIPASGGTPSVVARVDLSRQENSLRSPEFLADGHRFLYVARSGRPENTGAYVASIEGRPAARLFSTRSAVRATAAGDLLYVRDETLVTQRLEPDR